MLRKVRINQTFLNQNFLNSMAGSEQDPSGTCGGSGEQAD